MTFLSRAMFRSSLFTVFFFAMTSSVSAITFEGDQFAGEYKDWAIETEHFRIEYSTSISEGADLDNDGVYAASEFLSGNFTCPPKHCFI